MQAIGELVGTMMTNDANNRTNKNNIAWQAQSLQAQMNWQQYMRSTAYQAAMADMKQAGLNPMLAYQQGGGNWGSVGSAPGSNLRAENPHFGNAAAAGAQAFSAIAAAREGMRTQETTQDLQRSETAFNAARTVQSASETELNNARTRSEGGVPSVQQATIANLISSAREQLARIPMHEAETGRIRQEVVNRNEFGRGGSTTSTIEAITRLLERLRGATGNSASQISRPVPAPQGGGFPDRRLDRR